MLLTIAQSLSDPDLAALTLLAATIGFVHTITGPDHYVPFIAMSRIGGWSYRKTLAVTLACGVGHVGSSVVLGAIGIAAGLAVAGLEGFEGSRGNLAAWLLFGFGLAYAAWGTKRAVRGNRHRHTHTDGRRAMTPWILFTIFVLGPCEPLIPILMYPAAKLHTGGVVLVACAFGAATIGTMVAAVSAGYLGLSGLHAPWLARYSHAAAGLILSVCGAMMLLGL